MVIPQRSMAFCGAGVPPGILALIEIKKIAGKMPAPQNFLPFVGYS
jgi:hypothetical protein